MRCEQWKVFRRQLVLQRFGGRGDDDPLAGENGGHQVTDRLAGSGASLHDEVTAILDCRRDGGDHLLLPGPLFRRR